MTGLTASQLVQNAAKFNQATFRGCEKNQQIVTDLLDKATIQLENEEKIEKMAEERRNRNLFVKNLPFSVNSGQLRAAFQEFGNIFSARVMTERSGNSRGFGFVCFGTRAEAEAAQKKMDGRWVFGRRLYVSFAQAKAERAAELQRKYHGQAPRQERGTSMRMASDDRIRDHNREDKLKRKPASWGQSLMEKEEAARKEENEKKDSWDRADLRPIEAMLEEEPALAELFVPPHLAGTSKSDRRRNVPSPKKRGLGEADKVSAWGRKPKKMRKIVDWLDSQSLKRSLKKITIQELCELQEDLTFDMEVRMMDLGMGWACLLEGARKIYEAEKGRRVERWETVLEKDWENMVEEGEWEKGDTDEVDIEIDGIQDPLAGIVEVREDRWETLPKNVLEGIEEHLYPHKIARFRTCNRQVMGNWWVWPKDRCSYIRWNIEMQRRQQAHNREVVQESREREDREKAEKQRKREEEEEAQEARIPAALEEYLRDHGKIPGVGYRSVARKHRIDQQQLKDAVAQHEEEMLEDSDDDDPYP